MSKWLRLMDNVTFQPPEGLGLGFLKFCASPIEACWEPGPRKFCRMFDMIVWGLHIDSSVRSVSLSSQDQMLAQGRDLRFNFSGASTRTVRGSGSGEDGLEQNFMVLRLAIDVSAIGTDFYLQNGVLQSAKMCHMGIHDDKSACTGLQGLCVGFADNPHLASLSCASDSPQDPSGLWTPSRCSWVYRRC